MTFIPGYAREAFTLFWFLDNLLPETHRCWASSGYTKSAIQKALTVSSLKKPNCILFRQLAGRCFPFDFTRIAWCLQQGSLRPRSSTQILNHMKRTFPFSTHSGALASFYAPMQPENGRQSSVASVHAAKGAITSDHLNLSGTRVVSRDRPGPASTDGPAQSSADLVSRVPGKRPAAGEILSHPHPGHRADPAGKIKAHESAQSPRLLDPQIVRRSEEACFAWDIVGRAAKAQAGLRKIRAAAVRRKNACCNRALARPC